MANHERRKNHRADWNRQGEIISLTGTLIAKCWVKDISASGARILVSVPEVIPDYFRLHFGGARIPKCAVRWRSDKQLGVEFLLRRGANEET
jgi:hypothetical protein